MTVLIFHIAMGGLGLLSGAVTLVFRKGSRRHRAAGTIFVVAMVSMTTSAVYLGRHAPGVCLIALLALYMVVTAWRTARQREGGAGLFALGALLVALALAAGLVICGLEAANSPVGTKDGYRPLRYFVFGLVALFAGAGDLHLVLRGGLLGRQRIARHLWRMTFPWLIAANTLFQGQARLFPVGLRRTYALYVPILLVIGATAFWLVRVLFSRGDRRLPAVLHGLRI